MIIEIARSYVRAEVDGRPVTIGGEAYLPGFGSPDFVIYKASVQRWDPPGTGELIDE